MFFSAICVGFCGVVLWVHYLFSNPRRYRRIRSCRRVLLVIAHPDDEAMFFGPTILGLERQNCTVYVLCLSAGNYREQQGPIRKRELVASCGILGVPPSHVTVVEHSKLPDDPYLVWNRQILNDIILRHVEQLGADTVISFDSRGVSGHRNHGSIYKALQNLYTRSLLPIDTQVFVLESVPLLRKYTGVTDVLCSNLLSSYCYVSDYRALWRGYEAMAQHRSQLLWFRILYVVFSRYMVVNTLQRICMERPTYKFAKPK